jgi:hypothetical protein
MSAQPIRFQNGAASLNGNAISEKAMAFQIFYDSNRQTFLAPNSRAGWIVITTQDVRRWLKERGCRSKAKGKEKVSEIDALLTVFQREFDVEYAGSLAGHRRGLYEVGGKRILVKDSPVLIEPRPGSWPLLQGIIRNMLGQIRRFISLAGSRLDSSRFTAASLESVKR